MSTVRSSFALSGTAVSSAAISQVIEQSARWLLSSGIQSADGAVARYFRTDLGRNAPVSNEITGYFLSTLLFLGKGTTWNATAAAEYLAESAWEHRTRSLPFEQANGEDLADAHFFDCGIVGNALHEMWRKTGRERFLDRAIDIAQSMGTDFSGANGTFHPIVSLPEKIAPEARDWWSRKPGCYQLKSALLWCRLADKPADPGFLGLYADMLSNAFADSPCFLSTVRQDALMDYLHPFLYFLEGLLPVAAQQDGRRNRYSSEIEHGIDLVAEHLAALGPRFVRSDVYAQLIRIRLLAHALCGIPLDEEAAEGEVRELLTFHWPDPDPRIDGSFSFGARFGRKLPFSNPVSTAFAIQALSLWQDMQRGVLPNDWRILI